jgi:hypothetical protein
MKLSCQLGKLFVMSVLVSTMNVVSSLENDEGKVEDIFELFLSE